MPEQKPGKSKQDYGTPDDFMLAVQNKFGEIEFDLAASEENSVHGTKWFSEEEDSLKQDWRQLDGVLWLNPPYANIEPWAKKCSESMGPGRTILMLVPASVGSEWYRYYVEDFAHVLALNPRLTFKGCSAPYPKDCILAVYSHGLQGFHSWRWK